MESSFDLGKIIGQFEDLLRKNRLPSGNSSAKEEISIFISKIIEQAGPKEGIERLRYIRKAVILFGKLNDRLEPAWSATHANVDGRNGLRIYNNHKVIDNKNYKFDCRIWVNLLEQVELELQIVKTTRGRTIEDCLNIMVNLIDEDSLAGTIDNIVWWIQSQLDDIKRG